MAHKYTTEGRNKDRTCLYIDRDLHEEIKKQVGEGKLSAWIRGVIKDKVNGRMPKDNLQKAISDIENEINALEARRNLIQTELEGESAKEEVRKIEIQQQFDNAKIRELIPDIVMKHLTHRGSRKVDIKDLDAECFKLLKENGMDKELFAFAIKAYMQDQGLTGYYQHPFNEPGYLLGVKVV